MGNFDYNTEVQFIHFKSSTGLQYI